MAENPSFIRLQGKKDFKPGRENPQFLKHSILSVLLCMEYKCLHMLTNPCIFSTVCLWGVFCI